MRAVLDTNVIVSATLSKLSPPALILEAWDSGMFELLVSPILLVEYRRALSYDRVRMRHNMSGSDLDELIENYKQAGELVYPQRQVAVVTDDHSDNRILECAEAGAATHIVRGDRHLLHLGEFTGMPILSPREFFDLIEEISLDKRN